MLVGVAALDEALTTLLKTTFVNDDPSVEKRSISPLFGVNGPLASFWAKTHLANALGILSLDLSHDLEIMRRLRNRFAHRKEPVDFKAQEVKDLVESLSTTASFAEELKGRRYTLKVKKGGAAPSEARIMEMGYIKLNKAHFSGCVVLALTLLEITTTVISKGGVIAGRSFIKKYDQAMNESAPSERKL